MAERDFIPCLGQANQSKKPVPCFKSGENPYQANTALVANAPTFVGRRQIMHEIAASLCRPGSPSSVSLLGERRIGKSSLLNQMRGRLAEEPNLITLFANAQEWSQRSQRHFF